MRLEVKKSKALSAVIETLATIPREVAKQVRQQSKAVIVPEWKRGLAEHAPSRVFHERLVNRATAYVSDRGVKLVAGSDRADNFTRETEFGAYREQFVSYRRKGKKVTRRTQRQFFHYNPKGHVVYPTARDLIPRVGALWAQTTLRTVHEEIERAL